MKRLVIKVIIAGFALFVLSLLFIRVTLNIEMLVAPDAAQISVEAGAFKGLLKRKWEMDRFGLISDGNEQVIFWWQVAKSTKGTIISDRRSAVGLESVFKRTRQLAVSLRKASKHRWLLRLLRKAVMIESLNWRTTVGAGDAMNTALITGALWGIKGMILGLAAHQLRIRGQSIFVIPVYTRSMLKSQVNFTIQIRAIHSLISLLLVRKAKADLRIQTA